MKTNENEVKATGKIGVTYMTETGMHRADAEKHSHGWQQISATTRRKVESICISGHDPFYVWKFIEEKEH